METPLIFSGGSGLVFSAAYHEVTNYYSFHASSHGLMSLLTLDIVLEHAQSLCT